MGGGAWPFLVGGLVCLLNCDNERDLGLLNSHENLWLLGRLLSATAQKNCAEVRGNNRSVMPFDVLGRTRATLTQSASLSLVERLG